MLVGAVAAQPVTSYIESAAVWPWRANRPDGRRGRILFLCTLFFAPLVQAIPTAARRRRWCWSGR